MKPDVTSLEKIEVVSRKDVPALVKAIPTKAETLCIFMGLKDVKKVAARLKKWYIGTTPVSLVYRVSYAAGESLVKTTPEVMAAGADKATEKFLGLIGGGRASQRVQTAELWIRRNDAVMKKSAVS